jgi:hypothetical protein
MCANEPRCEHVGHHADRLRIQRHMAATGHAVQWVGAGEGEPCFAYTIGLTSDQLPELIIFGLSGPVSAEILNVVAHQVRVGMTLFPGQEFILGDGSAHVHVLANDVTDTTTHQLWANELCGEPGAPVRALQLIWSDWSGLYPGQPGCTLTSADQIWLG